MGAHPALARRYPAETSFSFSLGSGVTVSKGFIAVKPTSSLMISRARLEYAALGAGGGVLPSLARPESGGERLRRDGDIMGLKVILVIDHKGLCTYR
jgi:hypothetical protein